MAGNNFLCKIGDVTLNSKKFFTVQEMGIFPISWEEWGGITPQLRKFEN